MTSINTQLQVDVQNELASAIQRTEAEGNAKATTGTAVVMTTTGRIVAMASYPTYNPDDCLGQRHLGRPSSTRSSAAADS